ncbi:unnamed protein product, partial [Rotaria sp. Silwood2]
IKMSDPIRITIYECFSTIRYKIVKEKQISKSRAKLIEALFKTFEVERGFRVAVCAYIFISSFIGSSIHDYKPLKYLYAAEAVISALTGLCSYYTTWLKLKEETTQQIEEEQQLEEDLEQQVLQNQDKIEILRFHQPGDLAGRQITISRRVMKVRPHILCCIVKNINLATGNLQKYINLQDELNNRICKQGILAKIGTHDLLLISGNLAYDARNPDEIGLVPLGRGPKLISARNFYSDLCQDAEHERRSNRQNESSKLREYLTVIPDQNKFPCLSDQNHHIISLPPITDDERSKLTSSTESILIQITSEHSMEICRYVMDCLLREMLRIGLGKKLNDSNFRHILTLQQTRVVDDKGQLITTFPSRIDLDWSEISQETIVIERLTSKK